MASGRTVTAVRPHAMTWRGSTVVTCTRPLALACAKRGGVNERGPPAPDQTRNERPHPRRANRARENGRPTVAPDVAARRSGSAARAGHGVGGEGPGYPRDLQA